MSYFTDHYDGFQYPIGDDKRPGFRMAQLGAIHAVASHFSLRSDPAVVTMPTGSGKTAALIATAFVLRARRALVITPSRLVREQIAEEFASLATLREVGAVAKDLDGPAVFGTNRRITSVEAWAELRAYDVVVATVQSISPEFPEIPEPPEDLFDLVLVDEAHHSPARTWQAVLDHFGSARRVLFSATPFRQDQKEIKGRFVFTYDLRKAYDDGIFGEIAFRAVNASSGESHDVAIAKAAEAQLNSDRSDGLQHHIMVRTDSRKRAAELLKIYEASTQLRLRVVTGDKSLRFAKWVIGKLRANELDGIICVNMLGEGFNFPSLKVAAIHSPHRSLGVTLQFIGRFARVGGNHLGRATFLAVPSEIEIEAERLYDARAVWQDLVQNLSATRVEQEANTREVLESFRPLPNMAEDLSDLSLYVMEPYFHVKVYQLDGAVDFGAEVTFPAPLQVIYRAVSEVHSAVVYITREVTLPRWTTDDRLASIETDLFVFYQHSATGLLFVCASRRAEGLYTQLAASFVGNHPTPLALPRLNRALNDLEAAEFFNVGMRNRVARNTKESYRIITGSNADKAILKSDGRLYHRGHVFGRASDQGVSITIGISSASKIWSNTSAKLPDLIAWCEKLAVRIHSDRVPVTGSGLDHLDVGEEISELPAEIIAADWPGEVYRAPPTLRIATPGGEAVVQLLDLDLTVDQTASTRELVVVRLSHERGFVYKLTFSLDTDRYFEPASAGEPDAIVELDRGSVPLIDFLNDSLMQFYTADLSQVLGATLLRARTDDAPVFDDALIEVINWLAEGVDIEREFGEAGHGKVSIHDWLEAYLAKGVAKVVYYDHGSGEAADFVEIDQTEDGVIVRFYHCKGSAEARAGHRVADIYEVSAQAVKSAIWANKQRVVKHIRRRFVGGTGAHRFVKGGLDVLEQLLEETSAAQIKFEFIAVQPGLLKPSLPPAMGNVLAAASDHLVRGGFSPMRIFGSAGR